MVTSKRNKRRDLTALVLAIVIIILLNFVGSFVFHRFDLTSEKRYTLSENTRKLLKNLDDVVYVKVYLEGDFSAGFKNLRKETKEILDEFKAYADDNLEYEFINPSASPDKQQQKDIFKQLYDKGLHPTNDAQAKNVGEKSQHIIWPGAIVSYRGRELACQLFNSAQSNENSLNASIQALEYDFASAINNLKTVIKPEVAFISGHGELDTLAVKDIFTSLQDFYIVRRMRIDSQLTALNGFKTIIIAKPESTFSEKDKFIIDQFVMKGGRILWAVDELKTDLDTLRAYRQTMAVPYDLHLDDMLFKYGVRINPNLVIDMQSAAIPINQAMRGEQPNIVPMPWIFTPLANPVNTHPISRNLDVVKLDYASSIDTVATKDVRKFVLLQSSKYSKTLVEPVRVDLNYLGMKPVKEEFNNSFQTYAVLLKGEFESLYKNRIRPEIASDSTIGFKEHSKPTKMIVISDGDIIRNAIQTSTGKAYPLGFDKYTNQMYGNKNFILNCINYLCDDSGIISVRSRELTLRLLDKEKIKAQRWQWQLLNIALPIGIILLFGVMQFFVRKRKYAKQ
jgi:ABC-2 type transport system permease protein